MEKSENHDFWRGSFDFFFLFKRVQITQPKDLATSEALEESWSSNSRYEGLKKNLD